MRTTISQWAALAVLCAVASPAAAADPPKILPQAIRVAADGPAVEVVVPQAELDTSINVDNAGMGFGLIGVAVDAKINSDRANAASTGISALRMTLLDFDVDQAAIDTTKTALASLPWSHTHDVNFTRDNSVDGAVDYLSTSTASQAAFVSYHYEMAPDFSAVKISVVVAIADKSALPPETKIEDRLKPRNLAYRQTITTVAPLAKPTTGGENAARWAANNGVLLHKALSASFADLCSMIPRTLALTDADLKAMSAKDRKSIAGVSGTVIEDGPNGLILFDGTGLIHVQSQLE